MKSHLGTKPVRGDLPEGPANAGLGGPAGAGGSPLPVPESYSHLRAQPLSTDERGGEEGSPLFWHHKRHLRLCLLKACPLRPQLKLSPAPGISSCPQVQAEAQPSPESTHLDLKESFSPLWGHFVRLLRRTPPGQRPRRSRPASHRWTRVALATCGRARSGLFPARCPAHFSLHSLWGAGGQARPATPQLQFPAV